MTYSREYLVSLEGAQAPADWNTEPIPMSEPETYNGIQAGDTVWMEDIGDYGTCVEVIDYRHIDVKHRDGETDVIDVRQTRTSRT